MNTPRFSPSGPPFDLFDEIDSERLLGRDSPGVGEAEEVTIDQSLDWIPGATDDQWIFDGVLNSILIGAGIYAFERTTPFSASFWITSSNASTQVVIGNAQATADRRGWAFYIGGDGFTHLSINNTLNTNALDVKALDARVNDGQLHHCVVTYDGSSTPAGVVLYVDGVAQTTQTILNSLAATSVSTGALQIGIWGSSGLLPTSGMPRQVSIFSGVLTAGNVTSLYNGGVPPNVNSLNISTLLSYWKVDTTDTDGPGGFNDYGPGGFDGTAQNGLELSSRGNLIVRGDDDWETLSPGGDNVPLISAGFGQKPIYPVLGALGFLGLTLSITISPQLGGGPADIPIYVANAPFGMRIIDATMYTTTAIGGSSGTLRDASGGGGTAMTSALSTAANGTARNASTTGTFSIATDGSLFFRVTDNRVGGQLVLSAIMT